MRGRRLAFCLALAAAGGCVERRFVVETNVPGAQVYINNAVVGPSPADARWEYPGVYDFRIVAPGYEPLWEQKKISAKWYEYPGLDFFFDVVWPFHIEDVRRLRFELRPAEAVRTDELLDAANRLREQARQLPPPEQPDPLPTPAVRPAASPAPTGSSPLPPPRSQRPGDVD